MGMERKLLTELLRRAVTEWGRTEGFAQRTAVGTEEGEAEGNLDNDSYDWRIGEGRGE